MQTKFILMALLVCTVAADYQHYLEQQEKAREAERVKDFNRGWYRIDTDKNEIITFDEIRAVRPKSDFFTDKTITGELETWSHIDDATEVTYEKALFIEKSYVTPKRGEVRDFLALYSPETHDNITLDMMRAIYPEEIEEEDLVEYFNYIDRDSNDIITATEACVYYFRLQGQNLCYPLQFGDEPYYPGLTVFWYSADLDKNEELTEEEFVTRAKQDSPWLTIKEIKEWHQVHDLDNDLKWSWEEGVELQVKLENKVQEFEDYWIELDTENKGSLLLKDFIGQQEDLFKQMDLNKDGKVDRLEACIVKNGRPICLHNLEQDNILDYRFDLDFDGMFTVGEYGLFIGGSKSEKAVELSFDFLDMNNDGLLTLEEKKSQEDALVNVHSTAGKFGLSAEQPNLPITREEALSRNDDPDAVKVLFLSDANDDNSITWMEYCMEQIQSEYQCNVYTKLIMDADTNGDGTLNEKEFDIAVEDGDEDFASVLHVLFDLNGDREISTEEISVGAKYYESIEKNWDMFDSIYLLIDTDANGLINESEFTQLMVMLRELANLQGVTNEKIQAMFLSLSGDVPNSELSMATTVRLFKSILQAGLKEIAQ